MKKNIAVIYGGNSSEFEVSVNSGKQVSAHIDAARYNVYEVLLMGESWAVQLHGGKSVVEVDKSDFSFTWQGEKIKFDVAFIVIHGTPGEDGLLQAYFDMLHVPYTSCNAFVSTLTFNKYATKCFLRDAGVKMAKDRYFRKGDPIHAEELERQLGFPVFVKPNAGGSSCGVTKVKSAAGLKHAFEEAFAESDTVIVEEYIAGRELQQGVFKTAEKTLSLPVTEIFSHNEFFDYAAKYKGQSKEVTPAELTPGLLRRISAQSELIYDYLGCKGVVRIDYIVRDEDIYFLEINTVPGMSEQSIVPQQLRAAGISLTEAYTLLIENSRH
ncbi:MAG: D-alanine--D-alanine ligase [Prevotellaceae bacterium]|jgi:D-alanine-D-alanine ligase|nr:D-alanine--D-alanine ligase [Prevotellaceae bacterium]